jgi:hypothetical protein
MGTLIFLPPVPETCECSLQPAVLSSLRRVGVASAVATPEPAVWLIAALVSSCSTCTKHNNSSKVVMKAIVYHLKVPVDTVLIAAVQRYAAVP